MTPQLTRWSGSRAVVATALFVLGLANMVGCTADDPAPTVPADASTSTPRTSRSPSSTGADPRGPGVDQGGKACPQQASRAIRRLYWPLRQANDAVLGSSSGRSAHWARRLPRRATAAWRRLGPDCRGPAQGAASVRQLARARPEEQLTLAQVRRVLRAYADWARAYGVEADAVELLEYHDRCRRRRGLVTAYYRPLWAWTDSGKAHWVELRFTNRTPHTIGGTMRGRVWVRGLPSRLRPKGIPRLHDPERRAWALTWGGSSADMWTLRGRSTRALVAPVYFGGRTRASAFPTSAEGAIVGVTMSAEYYDRNGRQACPVLVRPG